ncbi:MAG: CDP-alcohol phosphatidyltransferase family protein [Acutalibacteraceae bacterium]
MANILTGMRIVCSIALLFVPTFSPIFYVLYLLAGITDMLDGFIARKFDLVSKFGAVFDTAADICFAGVCLIKLIPVLDISLWLGIWILIIAIIKIGNIALGFVLHKTMAAEHTVMNKIMGVLLFVFPLVLPLVDFDTAAIILCVAATFSALQEGYYIKKGKIIE